MTARRSSATSPGFSGIFSRGQRALLDVLCTREDALFAKGLLWIALLAAISLSFEVHLDWVALPKSHFVSVLGWLFPGPFWGSPFLLTGSRALLWIGALSWLLGPPSLRRIAAWASVLGMLLLGSLFWENLPWFRHKYVPPFWFLLLLAAREHTQEGPSLAPRWVREGAVCVLASFYGGSAVAKLLESGLAWGDGVALQLWFWKLGDPDVFIRDWMLESALLSRALASSVLLLELSCLLLPFSAKLRLPIGIGLLIFHLGVEWNFGIDFRTQMALIGGVLFPWPALLRRFLIRERAS